MSDETVVPLQPVLAYPDFIEAVNKAFNHPACNWRYGQLYFNMLSKHRPEIAEALRGTLLDPFYKDSIKDEVHNFVTGRWYGQIVIM